MNSRSMNIDQRAERRFRLRAALAVLTVAGLVVARLLR